MREEGKNAVYCTLLTSLARFAALTCLLAPPCLLRSCAALRSLVCSLAHFAHSLAYGKVYNLMSQYHIVLNHSVFVPTHGGPLFHISAYADKSLITGCCCNDTERELLQAIITPFPHHLPKKSIFGSFLTIFHHVPAYWRSLCSISACIENKFSPRAVAMISVKRKQLQAINTPSPILPFLGNKIA